MYAANDSNFEDIALRLFYFQAENNPIYRQYLQNLRVTPGRIERLHQVPFLPISFFKTQKIQTGAWSPEAVFSSSGTTGMQTSRHPVRSLTRYREYSVRTFEQFYGSLTHYHLLALLPAYLERQDSSLIAMIDHFIQCTGSEHSGFYLYNHEDLVRKIDALRTDSRKILVWGVSFALLDLAENFEIDLSKAIVMETGGMKGRRQEITRQELHATLNQRFNTPGIHSEYGMTELMSQAYSQGAGYYQLPRGMKVMIRELNDPFAYVHGRAGGINVVDLANYDTCAFVETHDLGKTTETGQFEILGRMDNSDVRGCNLLVE